MDDKKPTADNVPVAIEDERTSRSDASAPSISDSQIDEVLVESDSKIVEVVREPRTTTPGSIAARVAVADIENAVPPPPPAARAAAPRRAPESGEEARDLDRVIVGEMNSGQYRIDAILGKGGMGTMYEATIVRLDSKVALKRMMFGIAGASEENKEYRERFIGEARMNARVNHENVMKVIDCDVDQDGHLFYVAELLHGQTLGQILSQGGPVRPERAVTLALQTASGLEAMHAANVIHRDIKPSNVMVLAGDRVKIIDFGIAKDLREAARLTKPGIVAGTYAWTDPARLKHRNADGYDKPDPRADIYSLGLLLHAMLSGVYPYRRMHDIDIIHAKLVAKPFRIEETIPSWPQDLAELSDIIAKATEPEPADRYQTAGELRRALLDFEMASLPIGTCIAERFKVIRRLGRGAQGVVYEVEEGFVAAAPAPVVHGDAPTMQQAVREPGRRVALKLCLTDGPDSTARAQREIRLGQTVAPKDMRLVQVFEHGTWRDRIFFTMELLADFEPLGDVVASLNAPALFDVALEVAGALDTLDAHGVVHRDLSPNNINVGAGRRVKVFDLGLARELKANLTRTSMIIANPIGTPGYIGPQQYARAKDVESRDDQWALAANVYKALTGYAPYFKPGEDEREAEAIASAFDRMDSGLPLTPPHELNKTVPVAVSAVLMKALSRNVNDRYPTSSAFAQALRAVPATKIVLAYEDVPDESRASRRIRHWGVIAAACSIGIVGVVTAGVIVERGHRASHSTPTSNPRPLATTTAPHPADLPTPFAPAVAPTTNNDTAVSLKRTATRATGEESRRRPATAEPNDHPVKRNRLKRSPSAVQSKAPPETKQRSAPLATPYSLPGFGDE